MDSKCNFESVAVYANRSSRPTIGLFKNAGVGYFAFQVQWEALVAAVKKYDVNLICYSGGQIGCGDPGALIYDFVTANRLDGLLIWTGNISWFAKPQDITNFVKSYTSIPVISIEAKVDGVPSLTWDDREIGKVLSHLVEVHHCKRIAFVRGFERHSVMETRFQAYLQVLESYGITYDPDLVFPEEWIFQGSDGLNKINERLSSVCFDGLAGGSDWLVRQMINIMEERGMPLVPTVGFDDDIEGRVRRPILTTIRPPFIEISHLAVEQMLEMIAGRPIKENQCLPCSMIIRRSCGCALDLPQITETPSPNLPNEENDQTAQVGIGSDTFEKLVEGLAKVPQLSVINWKAKLAEIFLEEAQGIANNRFINYFESLLEQTDKTDGDFDGWNEIVSALFAFAKPIIKKHGTDLDLAGKIMQQAIMLIAEFKVRSEITKGVVEGARQRTLMYFNLALGRSVNLEGLLDQIYNGLVQLGILGFYLAIYDKPESSTHPERLILAPGENGSFTLSFGLAEPGGQGVLEETQPFDKSVTDAVGDEPGAATDQVRLILACDENGTRLNQLEGLVYPAVQLVPDGVLPAEKRFSYVVKAIYCQNWKLGFMLFQVNEKYQLADFQSLSNSIGTYLHSVLLIKKLSAANISLETANRALQENQKKLLTSEKMASLGRLTAGISHEMNTPLAAIRASLKTLGDLVGEYRQSIDNPEVLAEDHRSIAADMADQLKLAELATLKTVDFIRAINGQSIETKVTNLQWYNAAVVIKDTLNVLGFALRKGLCQLVSNLDESIQIYGDSRPLVQLITNLVLNGIEACKPDGGTITVALTSNSDEYAEILVEDTGKGIPAEILSRIFDPMFTTNQMGEGSGLGLSIIYSLVKEYGGTISVNSQKGLTAFKVKLPLV